MKNAEMNQILTAAGVRPNKKLGQNFLIDANFLDWIVRESGAAPGANILEVGPGFGALTERMLAEGATVTAVEFDHRIAEWLRQNLCPKGLTLVEGDACKVKLDEIYAGTDYKMVSNLPYSAGTIVVANLLDSPNPPEEMVIMLQKEVALRLAAKPGTHDYGALSVRVQVLYEATPLRIAPPEMFHPRPEVDSCVIRLKRLQNPPSAEYRKKLSQVVRLAFGQRRKKMIKQLTGLFGKEQIAEIYEEVGLKEDIRAERVTVDQFRQLTDILMNANKSAQ